MTVAGCMSFICSALVIADPVSFICSTLPSTMSDYNDDDDSSKVEELDMDGTSKATQKKKVLSDGYNRPPIIVSYGGEDIDVTQKYKKLRLKLKLVTH